MRKISPNFYVLADDNQDLEKSILSFLEKWEDSNSIFEFKSSGSTGDPKRIHFSKEELMESAKRTNDFFGASPTDWGMANLPLEFVGGAMVLIRALVANYSVLVLEPKENLFEQLKNIPLKISFASFLPNQWHFLAKEKDLLEKLFFQSKGILVGGASFPNQLLETTQLLSFPVYSTYGMTETLSHIALKQISPVYSNYYTCLPGIKIRANEDDCLEILLANKKQWLKTNDLIEILDDRNFAILGRRDQVVNSGGLKIHPGIFDQIMEEFLKDEPSITNYFFAGTQDDKYGEILILALESNDFKREEELLQTLAFFFPSKYLPKKILQFKQFEKTWNGKISIQKTLEKNV